MPGYLHARATGAHTPQNALRYFIEVHKACVERGFDRVLLDMALSGPPMSPSEIFAVISERSYEGSKLKRIAYLDTTGRDVHEMKFAETVAVNRGVNIRLFLDEEQAKLWISEKD